MGAIAELTYWYITVYWTIVVGHTVGFKEALRHTLLLSSITGVSYHMIFKNLVLCFSFRLKLNDSEIVGESYLRI